ncbi:MAG: hypothetical protein WAP51_04945 [Candidatus Sungiibacteriota bacterium]
MLKKSYIAIAASGLTLLPSLAFAQPRSVQDVIDLVNAAVGWFETIIFAIAIIMILVAAFQFLTAAGNEEKVSTARKSLVWGLVGIAVALFARVAKDFVLNALQRR